MNPRKTVLIFGLDGATFDLILPWVKGGKLPFLHDMMENGAHGDLNSTIPILTPSAWSSFMTGRNPGKHGILGFFTRRNNGYDLEVTNSTHRSTIEIWTTLSENGKKVGIVNVPLTYPPKKINGFMITGMMTPPNSDNFTYPVTLKEQVRKIVGESALDPYFTYLEREDVFINKLVDSTDKLARISSFLLETHRLDLFMVVFNGTDYVQHRFWGYIDPGHAKYQAEKSERYRRILLRYYQHVDEIIAELFALAEDEATVIVISDHGAGLLQKYIHINPWLMQNGFLTMKKGFMTRIKRFMYEVGLNPEEMYNFLLKAHMGNLGLKGDRTDRKLRFLLEKLFFSFSDVEWGKTRAYSVGSGLIYVNLKGREPYGTVNLGEEYESLRDQIICCLYQLKDSESGERIIEKVYRKEEIYKGPYLDILPDIVFLPKPGYMTFDEYEFGAYSIITHAEAVSAAHRSNGILLMKGPRIKRGVQLNGANIMDIAPTVLYLFGLPIPADMDGKVLVDILDSSYLNLNPIRHSAGGPLPQSIFKKNGRQYSIKDEEEIKLKLRDLGYIP